MSRGEIEASVTAAYESGAVAIGLVLVDGTSLVGDVPDSELTLPGGREPGESPVATPVYSDDWSVVPIEFSGSNLVLRDSRLFNEHEIFVPTAQIAGIYGISFDQPVQRRARIDPSRWARSSLDALFERSTEHARSEGLLVQRSVPTYSLDHEGPIRWGPVEFKEDTPLYCDWAFLSHRAGGLRSVGGGFVASASIGWSNSLWSTFRKLVARDVQPLMFVCQYKETAMVGHVSFLDRTNGERDDLAVEMDGARWDPAVITEKALRGRGIVGAGTWVLGYFRRDGLMVPTELSNQMSQLTHVWGEVYRSDIMTDFGPASCFVKARASAYLSRAHSSASV